MALVKKIFFITLAILGVSVVNGAQLHAIFDQKVVLASEGGNGGNMAGINS